MRWLGPLLTSMTERRSSSVTGARGIDAEILNRAVVVWTGFGHYAIPSHSVTRLTDEFGRTKARRLVPVLRALGQEMHSCREAELALAEGRGLVAAGAIVARDLREQHPELSEEAVRALVWSYTYDSR